MKLRDYQQEAIQAVMDGLSNNITRQLVVLPTGAGKTFTVAHIPQRLPGKVLFLAHREELLQQAADTFADLNPGSIVHIEQAGLHADIDADVVMASVQTLGRDGSDRIKKFNEDHFTSIIIDEAHHTTASTYQKVLDYFNPVLQLGITATPQRGDKRRLLDSFDEIVYYRTIQDMIKEGYLVDIVGYRINTGADLSGVSSRAGDYAINELSKAVNIKERNDLAVESYEEIALGKKTLVFAVDVDHAYALEKAFCDAGHKAKALDGTSEREERKKALESFGSGDLDILINVGLFTEGTDIPSIQCVLLARPTRSPVLLSQTIGRGLRLHPGKDECLVIDLCDATARAKPVGIPTLMGLPPDFDAQGRRLTEVKDTFEELAAVSPEEASRARSLDDITASFDKIDLFRPPAPNPELEELSRFVWMETTDDTYILNLNGQEKLEITGDALGRYRVWLDHRDGKRYELTEKSGPCKSMQEVFNRSDKWVKQFRNDQLNLLESDAEWRKDSPTEKQLKILRKHNVPITEDMSKGQASRIISKIFKDNPKPKRSARQQYMIEKKKREQRQSGQGF